MISWRKSGVVLEKIPRGVPKQILGGIRGETFGVVPDGIP